jgi:hypothetical protein
MAAVIAAPAAAGAVKRSRFGSDFRHDEIALASAKRRAPCIQAPKNPRKPRGGNFLAGGLNLRSRPHDT